MRPSRRLVRIALRCARPIVRAAGEPLAGVVERVLRMSSLKAGVALVYHVVGERTGDTATELVPAHGVRLFEAHLRHLRSRYRVVPAAELPDAVATRRRGERFPAAVTFDDDLAAHTEFALPVLRRVGLSATFFLSGASLEAPYSFWWERLQRAVDTGVPVPSASPQEVERRIEPREIRRLAAEVEELAPVARERWSEELLQRLGGERPEAGMRAPAVSALVDAGMTVGFHTRRHDGMTMLDDEQLAGAVRDGRTELESLAGARLTVIGYPHGRANGRVAAAARAAGFEIGYTTEEVAVVPGSDRLLLGRINPSYRSSGHLAVQLVRMLVRAHR